MIIYYDEKTFEKQLEYEVYLLNKYLTKHYNPSKAKALIKANASNLTKLAKSLGQKDVGFFCEWFLTEFFVANDGSDTIRPLSKTHYEIFDELNMMFAEDKYDKGEFILPRGLGKSTVINKALTCWRHCYKKSRYTIIIGKREEDSIQFVSDTKQMLSNKKIKEAFGILVDRRTRTVNKQELELTNNTKIMAISSGSSIRGTTYGCEEGIFRPSIIVVDDFINESDILTDNAKTKIVNKYYKEILEAGDKPVFRGGKKISCGSKFLVIGTPLSASDFINTIRQDPEFKVFHRSVCNFDIDEYFNDNKNWQQYRAILMNLKDEDRVYNAEQYYYEHMEEMTFERLWNDKWSCCYIANQYFTKRLTFMQELMCDCEKVGDIWIKYMAKKPSNEIESMKFEKCCLAVDPASSSNSNSDYFAFTILGKSNGFYLVRDGLLKRFDGKTQFDMYIDYMVELLHQYKEITHVILEKNVWHGIDAQRLEEKINEDIELKKRKIEVVLIFNTKNKDDRIASITDKINSGQIIFNEYNKEYNKQVFEFRGQKYSLHDDGIDSLALAINEIDNIKTIGKVKLLDRKLLF